MSKLTVISQNVAFSEFLPSNVYIKIWFAMFTLMFDDFLSEFRDTSQKMQGYIQRSGSFIHIKVAEMLRNLAHSFFKFRKNIFIFENE